jgi:hypothetical protein
MSLQLSSPPHHEPATVDPTPVVVASEDLAEAGIVVVKIEIDLCVLSVYNRIIRWPVPVPRVVLKIP